MIIANLYHNGMLIDFDTFEDRGAADDWLGERLTPSLYGEIVQNGEIIAECGI